MRLSSLLVLAMSLPIFVGAQSLAERLETLIEEHPASVRAHVGVMVHDIETDEVLFERDASKLFTPASNAKLYSSAAALDLLGEDKTFETQIETIGGIAKGNVLSGNITLRAGGDPVLTTDDLHQMAKKFAASGITSISGNVILDHSMFNSPLQGPGWMWDDQPDYYSMSISAMMLDYNVATVRVSEGASPSLPPEVALVPRSEFPPVLNMAPSLKAVTVTREPFSDLVRVRLARPMRDFEAHDFTLAVYDPVRWAEGVFVGMLEDQGVTLGDNLVQTMDRPTSIVVSHKSPPLSEIIPLFNKPSENAIGEMLIHHLALNDGVFPATWRAGTNAMGKWLTETVGLEQGSFRLVDGSGLSRYNLITAKGTVQLLDYMWEKPSRVTFVRSLPVAGLDGTLRSRMNDTAAQGRVFAKTGTMSGVSCLSGYVQTAGGRWLAFSVLTNGYVGSSASVRDLQDLVCVMLASEG